MSDKEKIKSLFFEFLDIFAGMLLHMAMVRVIISKTTFLDFLQCRKNAWLKIHKPELACRFAPSEFEKHLMEQGNEVELAARNLFPEGKLVTTTGDDAISETRRLMSARTPAIFQATFMAHGFIVKCDVLTWNKEDESWNLYEIKGTNSLRENIGDHDHIDDIAFQVSVLKRAGISIDKTYIIHLDKKYIRKGEIDLEKIFKIEDETEKATMRLSQVESDMENAREYLTSDTEPVGNCACLRRSRKNHCTTFGYSNPDVGEYSVHDISRISKKKLNELVESGVYDLLDVPPDFELTKIQNNQLAVHKHQKQIIDMKGIRKEIGTLKFPLYFFDYEAFGPAIPAFDGYGPYQRIPFQFSLHILRHPDNEPEHVEYLHEVRSDPSRQVAETLRKHIKSGGTIVVWHKSFEEGVNREIGERIPEFADFFQDIKESIYDLESIFTAQHYVHHGFRGSTSIKKVLPVLAPGLKYGDLTIHEGGQAADAWWKMVSRDMKQKDRKIIANDLRKYCRLDTYAMYAIWRFLMKIS